MTTQSDQPQICVKVAKNLQGKLFLFAVYHFITLKQICENIYILMFNLPSPAINNKILSRLNAAAASVTNT